MLFSCLYTKCNPKNSYIYLSQVWYMLRHLFSLSLEILTEHQDASFSDHSTASTKQKTKTETEKLCKQFTNCSSRATTNIGEMSYFRFYIERMAGFGQYWTLFSDSPHITAFIYKKSLSKSIIDGHCNNWFESPRITVISTVVVTRVIKAIAILQFNKYWNGHWIT